MSLLEEFIFALSKDERKRLRPLQFKGPKRRIFMKILESRDRKSIDLPSVLNSNRLTKQRYNQMLSEMLAACYRDISPRGGTNLIQFLGNKQLFRHVFYEMRRQEAMLMSIKNLKLLSDYYVQVTIISECFMVPPKGNQHLLEEARDYVRRYVAIKQPHPGDQWLLRTEEIDAAIEKETIAGFHSTTIKQLVDELKTAFTLNEDGEPLLRFLLASRLHMYHSRLLGDKQSGGVYYQAAKAVIEQSPTLFRPIRELFELRYEIETAAHGMNKLRCTSCIEYFEKKINWENALPLILIYEYFQMILKAGDLKLAKKYLKNHFPYHIDLLRSDTAMYYWKLFMLYYLYADQISRSEKYLRKAFLANRGKSRNIRFDILLRDFEVFFIAMKGDPVVTIEACERTIRHAKKYGSQHKKFIRSVEELMKCVGIDIPLANTVHEKYLSQASPTSHLTFLYERIYAKFFAEQ